jgi:hypothetical protein
MTNSGFVMASTMQRFNIQMANNVEHFKHELHPMSCKNVLK